jgi:hypothetical protein
MDGSFTLYVPKFADEDAPLPFSMKVLMALAVKIDDEEWVEEILQEVVERLSQRGL